MEQVDLGPAIVRAIDSVARELELLLGGKTILDAAGWSSISDVEVSGFGTRATISPKVWIRDRVDAEFGAQWHRIAKLPDYLAFERLWLEQFGYRTSVSLEQSPAEVAPPLSLPTNVNPTAPSWIVREGIATKLLGDSVEQFARRVMSMTDEAAADPLPRLTYEAPLQNFDAEGIDRIDISEHIFLRRYTAYERAHLLGGINPTAIFGLTNLDLQFTAWAVVTHGRSGHEWTEFEAVQEKFETVLSALRLFQEPPIGLLGVSQFWEPWHRLMMGGRNLYHQTQVLSADRPQAEYRLEREDIDRFRDFFGVVSHILEKERRGPLPVAIRRLNDTYFHTRWVDRYVDAVIAMEALFLSGQRESQGFRFAACGSVLLGNTPDEREALFRKLRMAYSRRSAILHGSDSDVEFEDLREIESLARRAVLRTLALPTRERGELLASALESRLVRGSGD